MGHLGGGKEREEGGREEEERGEERGMEGERGRGERVGGILRRIDGR